MTMNPSVLHNLVNSLEPPSELWRQKALSRLDTLTKPIGSLGRLEELAAQASAILQRDLALPLKKQVFVFAADHGVTTEGVSAYPTEVTYQMVLNFLREGAAVNVLSKLHRAGLTVVDVGVDADFQTMPGLLHRKVSRGTRNMRREPAMTEEQALQAIAVGFELAHDAASSGTTMVAIGEMGIGNTTAASAITCALTGASPEHATGRGTGISPTARLHKMNVVQGTLEEHFGRRTDLPALEILRRIGGLEIAAMAGMILGAAERRMIVVIDGFISTAAAALVVRMVPSVSGYIVAGHCSEEPGHRILLDHLRLDPILSLKMRLGEGTGAVLAMPILESAIGLYANMATFASAGVSGAS